MKKITKSFQRYWLKEASYINWLIKPKKALVINNKKPVWYPDGQINIFNSCIEKNLKKHRKKIAITYFDKDKKKSSYNYEEISNYTKKLSFILHNISKKKKIKNILIYGASSIETTISIFACSQLGIHFSVIFEDLSLEAVMLRAKLLKADFLISRSTNIEFYNKILKTKKFNFKNILYFHQDKQLNTLKVLKLNLDALRKKKLKFNRVKKFQSNKNFFTLFTSGSTGEPKGITHSYGNFLVYANHTSRKKFGLNMKSVVLAASDAGWINGHTYALFGPLSIGSSTILLEKPSMLLEEEFLNELLLSMNISVLYLPVTLIRMMKSIFSMKYKSKYLKTIGSMGEPLAKDVGKWYANYFNLKNKSIINTYFQTETGGIISSPSFLQTTKSSPHGSIGKTTSEFLKIKLDKKDSNQFKIINYWPGMMKKIVNGEKIYKKYFDNDGYFKLYDTGKKIKNTFYVYGRVDDVLNIRGHRIGSGEVESVVLSISDIKEASAVNIDNSFTGQSIILFISLKNFTKNHNLIKKKVRTKIINIFGKFALPEKILIIKEMPKTKSGKILRRLLRNISLKKDSSFYGDLSTISDYSIINNIKSAVLKG